MPVCCISTYPQSEAIQPCVEALASLMFVKSVFLLLRVSYLNRVALQYAFQMVILYLYHLEHLKTIAVLQARINHIIQQLLKYATNIYGISAFSHQLFLRTSYKIQIHCALLLPINSPFSVSNAETIFHSYTKQKSFSCRGGLKILRTLKKPDVNLKDAAFFSLGTAMQQIREEHGKETPPGSQ